MVTIHKDLILAPVNLTSCPLLKGTEEKLRVCQYPSSQYKFDVVRHQSTSLERYTYINLFTVSLFKAARSTVFHQSLVFHVICVNIL